MADGVDDDAVDSLRRMLAASWTRVRDVFAAWDNDGNGQISRSEFSSVLSGLRLSVSREEAAALFDLLDEDRSGTLDYRELHSALRQGSKIELDAALQVGAQGDIATEAKNKAALRKEKGGHSMLDTVLAPLALGQGENMVERLRNAMTGSWSRVKDLFLDMDADGNGAIDREELFRALALLGLQASRSESDALFATFDADASGEITLEELRKLLRRGADIELDAVLRAGALGAIEVASANKIALRRGGPGKVGSNVVNGVSLAAAGSAEAVLQALTGALSDSLARFIDLFREWDVNGDGMVDRTEWVRAMRMLGVSRDAGSALFDVLDDDRSGTIEYSELREKLRHGAAGRAGDGAEKPRFYRGPSSIRERVLVALPCLGGKLLCELAKCDADSDGAVTKAEFVKAVFAAGTLKGFESAHAERDGAVLDALHGLYAEANAASGNEPSEPLAISLVLPRIRALARELEGRGGRSRPAMAPEPAVLPVAARRVKVLEDLFYSSLVQAKQLFETWDVEARGDECRTGTFGKEELRRALPALKIGCTKVEADCLFAALDEAGSGEIDYTRLGMHVPSGRKKRRRTKHAPPAPAGMMEDLGSAYFLPGRAAPPHGAGAATFVAKPLPYTEAAPEAMPTRAQLLPSAAEDGEPAVADEEAATVVALPVPPGKGRNSARGHATHVTPSPRKGRDGARTKGRSQSRSPPRSMPPSSTNGRAASSKEAVSLPAITPRSSELASAPAPAEVVPGPEADDQLPLQPQPPSARRAKINVPSSPRSKFTYQRSVGEAHRQQVVERQARLKQPQGLLARPSQNTALDDEDMDAARQQRLASQAAAKAAAKQEDLDRAHARIAELERLVQNLAPPPS